MSHLAIVAAARSTSGRRGRRFPDRCSPYLLYQKCSDSPIQGVTRPLPARDSPVVGGLLWGSVVLSRDDCNGRHAGMLVTVLQNLSSFHSLAIFDPFP